MRTYKEEYLLSCEQYKLFRSVFSNMQDVVSYYLGVEESEEGKRLVFKWQIERVNKVKGRTEDVLYSYSLGYLADKLPLLEERFIRILKDLVNEFK